MSTYSAGLLNVGTLDATGASAQLTANDVIVTNLTVNGSVNASNLNFTDLNVAGQLKVGEFDYINQNVSSGFKAKMDAVNSSYSWDASKNPEVLGKDFTPLAAFFPDLSGFVYRTKLPFTQYDGSWNTSFTPQVCNQWNIGDNQPYTYFNGKRRSGIGSNNTMDASNTLLQGASTTKLMTALLFARMCTLGVFQAGKPILVSDYIPVLNNIKFVVPYYEDFPVSDASSTVNTDLSNNRTAWNVKDASGNPYRVPYVDLRSDGTPYLVQPGLAAPPIEMMGVQGKYVNVYKSTRPLYLQDVLAESVGFVTGFADGVLGQGAELASDQLYDQNFNYGWTAAVKDTSAGYYPDASHEYLWKGNPNAGTAANVKGAGLTYNATNDFFVGTNNTLGWNNTIAYARATSNNRYPQSYTPIEHIEHMFNDFSGQTYMQLFEHGSFNYNSSETFGPAVLTEAYHRKFPDSSALDYYDILDKELFIPVLGNDHSFTYYFDHSGNAPHGNLTTGDIATSWTIYNPLSALNPLRDLSSYIVSLFDSSIDAYTGVSILNYAGLIGISQPAAQAALQKPAIYTYFTDGSGSNKARLYIGNGGLFYNISDYMKILGMFNKRGVFYDSSGNLKRLINASDISVMNTPSVDLLETQNLQYNVLNRLVGGYFSGGSWAFGQTMIGPTYTNGTVVDYSDSGSFPSPALYTGAVVQDLVPAYFAPAAATFNGSTWGGAFGTAWLSSSEKNTYGFTSAMAYQIGTSQGFHLSNAQTPVLDNELILPGSNDDIVPRQV
jgi:hypothetical protein